MSAVRTLVVGDVHGCLDELDALLEEAKFLPGRDELWMVGDLVDRGPDSVGVVRRARALGARSVLGNHEEKHLRFRKHAAREAADPRYRNPMKPLSEESRAAHEALDEADWQWLGGLPIWRTLADRWVVVHGGLEPRWPLARQNERLVLRIREVDERGKFVSSGDPRVPVPGSVPWASRWRGPESVLYGHQVHGLERPRVDAHGDGVECWGLDTGCVFGGRLTAFVWPAGEIVQVDAKRAYASLETAPLE